MASVRVGDGLTIAGSTSIHEVVNVTSDTQLSVSPVYAGTTGSGKAFGVVPVQGYTKDLADQAKSLLLSYSSIIPSTGPYDTTPGRVLRVGDFGIGSSDLQDYGGDLNDLVVSGFYLVATPALNQPAGYGAGFVTVKSNGSNNVAQTYEPQGTNFAFERQKSGTWGPWRMVFNQVNIVGTVSQTSGIPTGAILESGNNANGYYFKFANGLLVQGAGSMLPAFQNTSNIGMYWTYPVAFSSYIMATINVVGTLSVVKIINSEGFYSRSLTGGQAAILSAGAFVASDIATYGVYFDFIAVGRWFG